MTAQQRRGGRRRLARGTVGAVAFMGLGLQLAVVSGHAASLPVDGGVSQVFTLEVVPPPPAPASLPGRGAARPRPPADRETGHTRRPANAPHVAPAAPAAAPAGPIDVPEEPEEPAGGPVAEPELPAPPEVVTPEDADETTGAPSAPAEAPPKP